MTRTLRRLLDDERGSAPVEFVLVGTLLTMLTLGVLQFGFAVYVRNVVHDAAVEGAYHAALADTTPAQGAERTRAVIERAVGSGYGVDVRVGEDGVLGYPAVRVTVAATLPLAGLLGVPRGLEVQAHAPIESFD
ncbi:TadE/TadG family type IV pilus assembly protein [Microbacterium caowuchunii]|uniref:TadE/TadG family type IV pilus assembly protein n=1 Tax=Microbacterium caowuchunii TaxID=2614638 RepID=UPI00177A908A|nr:TadE/TadG family type IV pilus assembly protein [Microbacterium caowuchunii]